MDNKTIFTVKISDNYCEWEYAIQVDNKRCIKDFVKCIEGGLSAKVVNEKLINNYDESNQINMENFKLDLTQLTPVAEADRIKGNWYVVADSLKDYGTIRQWHCENNAIDGGGGIGIYWRHWLQIPPNLPGFPKAELPDEFELKRGEWEYIETKIGWDVMKVKTKLPKLTIPSGTKSEQVEALRKYLAQLETK